MKKILLSLLALCCFTTIKSNTCVLTNSSITKGLKLIDESEDEEYYEDDYEYDGFLDEVIVDATMEDDEEHVYFNGYTSYDYGEFNFSVDFNIFELTYDSDFSESGIDVVCDQATIDEYGRLESEIVLDNPNSGEQEIYKVSDYRNLTKLERFLQDPDQEETLSLYSVSTCWLFSKIVAAIVAIYVVVTETAEQIKARYNYRDNQQLESGGNGVNYGNYITNQHESSISGYKSADYKFGFTTFSGVGCEVASVYNLMLSEGLIQNLSEVIYNFEKWAIEFAVGWGYLGSNPRDIYRYLRNYNIKYSKNTLYALFYLKVYFAPVGTKFIMSTWNTSWTNGLHTYFFVKQDYGLETYNFNPQSSTDIYDDLDNIYSQTGSFIVGYKIYA